MFGKRIGTISWTPEIRAEFIQDWTNDKWMKDKGFVKKKNHDEMHDDNDSGRRYFLFYNKISDIPFDHIQVDRGGICIGLFF